MSLVESCPSTEMRSNERLTQTPSSRSAVSAGSAASVCTKHSIVANAGWIIPAPLAWAVSRTVPPGRSTSSAGALLERVGGHDRRREVARRRPGAARPTASRRPGDDLVPVELARRSRRSRRRRPGRARPGRPSRPRPASGRPRRGRARRSRRWRCRSWRRPRAARRAASAPGVTSTGAASTPERVNRAALVVSGESQTSRPMSLPPLGLIPHATPAARKPWGSPPSRLEVAHASGTSTQRDVKKRAHLQARRLVEAEHEVEVLDGLRRRALPQVVDGAEHERLAGARVDAWRGCGRCWCRARRARRAAGRRPRRTARRRRRSS